MDAILLEQIARSAASGDLTKLAGFVIIFIFLWIEVRGLKNEMKKLNESITQSLKDGELRFERVEDRVSKIDERLKMVESH